MEEGGDHDVALGYPLIAGHGRQAPVVLIEPSHQARHRHEESSSGSCSSCQVFLAVVFSFRRQLGP